MEDEEHEALRRELDRRLASKGFGPVSDADWHRLVRLEDPTAREEMWLEDAVGILARWREPPRRSRTPPITVESPDPRYSALSEILALDAARDHDVRRWRERFLPQGALIPLDRLGDFLKTTSAERTHEVKVIGTAYSDDASFKLPGERFPVSGLRFEALQLQFRDAGGSIEMAPAFGPLAELALLGDDLADRYGWYPADAVTFVVTGQTPALPPALLTVKHNGRWVIEVDPRLPRATLANFYERTRVDLGIGQSRKLDKKTAALAVFLAQHGDLTWDQMRESWNQEHREWTYGNYRDFRRDATTAWKRVTAREYARKPALPT